MENSVFDCPYCSNQFSVTSDFLGGDVGCPSCGETVRLPAKTEKPKVARSENPTKFPIVIKSSVRALYATYIWSALLWLLVLVTAIVLRPLMRDTGLDEEYRWIWVIVSVAFFIYLFRLWINYRRIKNTVYKIFPKKIQVSSYSFKFLGVFNNVVNLAQLRQIQASVNSLLDLWFFKCGKVILTVSGDRSDFVIENVHRPASVKRQVEEVAFGKEHGEPEDWESAEVSD